MRAATGKKLSGIALLAGAALFGALSLQRIPAAEALVSVSGSLVSFTPSQPGKYGRPVRFQIGSDRITYQYVSIGGETRTVEDALRQAAGRSDVRILIDPEDDFVYPNAFEVVVGERVIRSRDQILAGFESNRNLGRWIAGALAVAGLLYLGSARRMR